MGTVTVKLDDGRVLSGEILELNNVLFRIVPEITVKFIVTSSEYEKPKPVMVAVQEPEEPEEQDRFDLVI